MDTLQIIILALIQGITEFLPISSSAHLILPAELLNWRDQGLAFDVAVHVGTLMAVLVYFRQDIGRLILAWFGSLRGQKSQDASLAWNIIWATIPVGVVGLLAGDFIEQHLRSVAVIAATTIIFGLLLGWADYAGKRIKPLSELGLPSALIIGLSQALALIPGTSRSGITMTTALALGYDRQAAARFSFLLSIPVITLSGAFKAYELIEAGSADWYALGLGSFLAGVSAWLCIHWFLKLIDRIGMWPFVVYRLLLGGALIAFIMM
ncbi:undecaprenyl-diphosphate phosphatase [Maricurvus nonylphenolicus]|uniref:undecaprenyl-diphosphate phosphatase n=1 Tax=Maricurvus nonylphenolicus TaxID=1008307 RepID=UPI0036F27E57